MLIVFQKSFDTFPYEIIANNFLGGVIIRAFGKITFVNKKHISPTGRLSKQARRKVKKSSFAIKDLDALKALLLQDSMQEKISKIHKTMINFHHARSKDYTHEISLMTDAKQSKNRICVYSPQLAQPIFYGFDDKVALDQNLAERNAVRKAIDIAAWLRANLLPSHARVLLTVHTDCKGLLPCPQRSAGAELRHMAKGQDLGLNLCWISGKKNSADFYTVRAGAGELNLLTEANLPQLQALIHPRGPDICVDKTPEREI